MTITITLDHSDIVGTESREFESLFIILQAYAKMTKGPMTMPPNSLSNALNDAAKKSVEEKVTVSKTELQQTATNENTSEPPKNSVENSIDRKSVETEIKQIALNGKEKGLSKKIKELIQGYGFEKLSEVPDKKILELLEKVRAL